jgi:predicted RNA-binding Zn ribbon-like protein
MRTYYAVTTRWREAELRRRRETSRVGRHFRIKECEGEECGWVFVDATKSGTRRWSSMASCGARAKMKRYRARPQRSRSF